MRKFIMLIFIIGFVGSASAAEVTYHFTAEIHTYSDGAEIFSEMGYSADMELKGTITYDPEIAGMTYGGAYDPNAWGWWTTGVIAFENQGYSWLDNCNRYIMIQNASTDREITISTRQGNPINPDDPEMMQVITATVDGLDASMPSNLDLGNSPQYIVQFTKEVGVFSFFKANITSLMTSEEYTNSATQLVNTEDSPMARVEELCPCERGWKNHGAYVRCVAQAARELVPEGSKAKGAIVSEAAKRECGKKK